MSQRIKNDKTYTKVAPQDKQTKQKVTENAKSSATQKADAPGGFTKDGYRKHPYHKPSWDPYPNIRISKGGNNENTGSKTIHNVVHEKLMQLKPEKSNPRVERERSAGNVSIRNVIERLEKKTDKSLHYRQITITLPWIVRFLAKYSLIWESINYLNIIITCLLTSFCAFFSFYDPKIWGLIRWMDLMFATDTIIRLTVEIWRNKRNATVVVFTAPYTMLQFLLDLLSMAPFNLLFFWIEGSHYLDDIAYIELFTVNRFIRLIRCIKFFETLERQRMVNEKILFLFTFSNYYFAFIIFTTCLLFFSIGATPMDYLLYKGMKTRLTKTYLHDFQMNKKDYGSDPWDIFVITLNFATAVVTTVGYGDVVPNSELEMAICIFCMLFGAIFLNGQFTGELTNFETEIDGARFDLYYRVREIRNFLASIKTRPFFNGRVEEYYNYLWTYREGVFDVAILRALPQTFHEELLFDICMEMFDKSNLFSKLDPAFLRALSKIVTIALYNSNMVLCRQGKHASKLFYILQGECQALSKLNPANPSAIIRAGSIIGEPNLIFSFPYTTTVETRTCCQFIILSKMDLFEVIEQFPIDFETVRSRSQDKIKELHETHQAYGADPVCWVKARTDLENPSKPNAEKLRRNMRWAKGLNHEVVEDVVDDSEDNVIFSTPCADPTVEKDHLIPYVSCAVPEIMNTKILWIKVFNLVIMFIAMWYAFFGPYCLVFGESTKTHWYICRAQHYLNGIISAFFVADVFVEIIGACPVAGWYYKFWDGLHVVSHRPTFYLDLLAALPLDIVTAEDQNYLQILGTVFKVLKLWKVIRFLHYLDEVYPLKLFWFRLAQTIIVLLYGIHFIACITYNLACPYIKSVNKMKCSKASWLGSYETIYENTATNEPTPTYLKHTTLGYDSPYLYSFFYSSATLTSAGFGDFNPQNQKEMMWAIGFMLFGFYLIGYYTSVLTSALSCLVRPKLALQQKLVSLYQFMNHYHLREHLKDRIVDYFVLQHQFRGGVPINQSTHLMYDAPGYLRDDVLYLETHELLDGVPIFSKVDSDVIIQLSASMHRFIIPPNTTFVMKGEVRRILYIIKHGSMGVFGENLEVPQNILESTCHFGLQDLIFGEPYHNTYRSLSYVALYSIKRKDFEECLQYEDDFWELVNEERERRRVVIHEMTMIYSSLSGNDIITNDKASSIPSWVVIPPRIPPTAKLVLGQVNTKMIKEVNMLNDEYDNMFKNFKAAEFLKKFLLRKSVHPVGTFSKFWNCLMSLVCCLTVVTLMLETFCYLRMPQFRLFQMMLDWFNYIDIYLKFHWSYYNPHNGMLITHPLKTAMNYVFNGSLVLDVAICAPIELLMWIFKLTTFWGYGKAASWYSRLRWIRFFQFKRIPIVFQITHDIFKNRNMILLFLYILSTIFVCTIVSAIAQFIACPWEANDWFEGDENRIPICNRDSWVGKKFSEAHTNPAVISGVMRRWVLGVYYVSQVILVIGFGDMITLNKADIILLIFMSVFGFLFIRCVIADMTAAEVDSDEARATFVENMAVLDLVLTREKVSKKISYAVLSHLRNTWHRSRGLQTRDLFGELHPLLESELYRNLMGDKLGKVPVFHNFPPTVLSSLCRYMKTQYVLRGIRIMRYGNLEYEMCIINHGKVYITDRSLNYICSLNPGDSFGETAVIYGLPRRYNAIAATDLEIYVLSAAHYENFLGRYPNFRNEMITNLSSEKKDYFESVLDRKMRRALKLSPQAKAEMLNTFEKRTAMVRDLLSLREDPEQSGLDAKEVKQYGSRNRIIGYGDLDDNLPLLYFTYPFNPNRRTFRIPFPVIHPNCLLIREFVTIISWLCFVTPAIAAYEVCFSREFLTSDASGKSSSFVVSKYLHMLSEVIEYIFLFFICLQFVLAYEIKPGLYNKSIFRIFLRYVTAIDGLIYDLLASGPFIVEKILLALNIKTKDIDPILQPYINNMSLLRSIRLYQYFKTQLGKKNDLNVSTFRLQITLSVTSFCLMAHMLACLFYKISPCTRPDLSNNTFKFSNLCPAPEGDDVLDKTGWTTEFAINKGIKTTKERLEAWRWWFRSLYWVVTTISTTGFGDIAPTTINEMAVGIICIFCGAFVLSIILSQFTSGLASLTKTKRGYMYQVLLLVKHLKNIGLSPIRQAHVMMYFLTMWDRCRGVPYHKVFKHLPISDQIEVAYALFGNTLNKVPFFVDSADQIFIRQLSKRVVHTLYIPGIYIHKYGDPGSTLFIVYKGVVSGTEIPNTGELPPLLTIYNPGDSFGRFAALFQDGTYKKSYRAECMVEILEVNQSDILHLARRFPFFKRKIKSYIASRYNLQGSNYSIFERKKRKGTEIGAVTAMNLAREAEKHHINLERKKKKQKNAIKKQRALEREREMAYHSSYLIDTETQDHEDIRKSTVTSKAHHHDHPHHGHPNHPDRPHHADPDHHHHHPDHHHDHAHRDHPQPEPRVSPNTPRSTGGPTGRSRSSVKPLPKDDEKEVKEYWTHLNDMPESTSTRSSWSKPKKSRQHGSGFMEKSFMDRPNETTTTTTTSNQYSYRDGPKEERKKSTAPEEVLGKKPSKEKKRPSKGSDEDLTKKPPASKDEKQSKGPPPPVEMLYPPKSLVYSTQWGRSSMGDGVRSERQPPRVSLDAERQGKELRSKDDEQGKARTSRDDGNQNNVRRSKDAGEQGKEGRSKDDDQEKARRSKGVDEQGNEPRSKDDDQGKARGSKGVDEQIKEPRSKDDDQGKARGSKGVDEQSKEPRSNDDDQGKARGSKDADEQRYEPRSKDDDRGKARGSKDADKQGKAPQPRVDDNGERRHDRQSKDDGEHGESRPGRRSRDEEQEKARHSNGDDQNNIRRSKDADEQSKERRSKDDDKLKATGSKDADEKGKAPRSRVDDNDEKRPRRRSSRDDEEKDEKRHHRRSKDDGEPGEGRHRRRSRDEEGKARHSRDEDQSNIRRSKDVDADEQGKERRSKDVNEKDKEPGPREYDNGERRHHRRSSRDDGEKGEKRHHRRSKDDDEPGEGRQGRRSRDEEGKARHSRDDDDQRNIRHSKDADAEEKGKERRSKDDDQGKASGSKDEDGQVTVPQPREDDNGEGRHRRRSSKDDEQKGEKRHHRRSKDDDVGRHGRRSKDEEQGKARHSHDGDDQSNVRSAKAADEKSKEKLSKDEDKGKASDSKDADKKVEERRSKDDNQLKATGSKGVNEQGEAPRTGVDDNGERRHRRRSSKDDGEKGERHHHRRSRDDGEPGEGRHRRRSRDEEGKARHSRDDDDQSNIRRSKDTDGDEQAKEQRSKDGDQGKTGPSDADEQGAEPQSKDDNDKGRRRRRSSGDDNEKRRKRRSKDDGEHHRRRSTRDDEGKDGERRHRRSTRDDGEEGKTRHHRRSTRDDDAEHHRKSKDDGDGRQHRKSK